jgi:hypothetical protein
LASKKKINKTQLILDALAKYPNETPMEIADRLKAYKISAGYVSTIKSARKAGKKKAAKKSKQVGKTGRRARRNGDGDNVSMSSLVKAKQLADELGGVEKAKAVLDALAKLTG